MWTLRRVTSAACAALLLMGAVALAATPASALPPPGGFLPNGQGALNWGLNFTGQLGDGTPTPHDTPVEPLGLHKGVRQISAGGFHTLAVLDTGTVNAWGSNSHGQLGDGTNDTHFVPLAVPKLFNITQVSAGPAHSLALASDGTVWAWGQNFSGALGDGTTQDRLKPVQVVGLTKVVQVAAGNGFSLALRDDGRVWGWGENSAGQLGDGTLADRTVPVNVFGLTDVVHVAAGGFHSLAARSNGQAVSWGSNSTGALGDGTFVPHFTPAVVPLLNHVTQVAAGDFFSLFLLNDGVVQWGEEIACNFGDGDVPNDDDTVENEAHVDGETGGVICPKPRSARFLPVEIRGGVRQISAGDDEGAAILFDGTVRTWFAEPPNEEGIPERLDPVKLPNVANAIQVDLGTAHGAVVVDRPMVIAP